MEISKIRFRCHANIMTDLAVSYCCFEWIQRGRVVVWWIDLPLKNVALF